MNDLVIIDHHLDEEAGVYRLVVGYAQKVEAVALDESGEPVMLDPEPVMAKVPVIGSDGTPEMTDLVPAMRPKLEMVKAKSPDGKDDVMELRETGELEPAVDEKGDPIMLGGTPVLTEQQLHSPEGEPLFHPPMPLLEERTEFVPVEDFLFAADDKRWKKKSPEAVAKAQRELVREALIARAAQRDEEAKAAARTSLMPGVGETL